MKKLIIIFMAAALSFGAVSCKKYVEGEDISPNSPADAPAPMLLSTAELSVFATYGGNMSRIASMWSQQSAGVQFQSADIDQYALAENDVENEWSVIYTRGLKNLKILKNKVGAANPHYQGISSVLSALMLGVATDCWGDIPYREALRGESLELNSAYDPQQQVLADIQSLLDEGIASLKKSSNVIVPGGDDFIYGGDAQKWIGMAYVLKARYHMRTSKQNASWYVDALAALDSARDNGFTGPGADANCQFGTNSNEYNQWYAFCKVSRQNYIKAGDTLVDLMNAQNDPRLEYYFTKNDSGKYAGSALGSGNITNVSEIGSYFASSNSPTPLVTYVESKFIEAEALLAKGDKAGAATAYNDAVINHVNQITGAAPPPAFVTAVASENAGSIDLVKIMTQKYISGYTMMEPWNDWRRTNIPALKVNTKGNLGGIARRFPTPLSERLYNSKSAGNIFGQNELDQRVWWDKP